MTLTEAKKRIRTIDKAVDVNRAELESREQIDEMDAASWQAAWDKNPDLKQREDELFTERGQLQLVRDNALAPIFARKEADRKRHEVKCATKRTGVFGYLYECKRAAELLGMKELAQGYADALVTYREAA